MKKIFLSLFILTSYFSKAQPCNMQIGYHFNIYVFAGSANYTFKEMLGEDINPMLVNLIFIRDAKGKQRIDEMCAKNKMETTIFVYPSHDKTNNKVFCNQQEYLAALKSNEKLVIAD